MEGNLQVLFSLYISYVPAEGAENGGSQTDYLQVFDVHESKETNLLLLFFSIFTLFYFISATQSIFNVFFSFLVARSVYKSQYQPAQIHSILPYIHITPQKHLFPSTNLPAPIFQHHLQFVPSSNSLETAVSISFLS